MINITDYNGNELTNDDVVFITEDGLVKCDEMGSYIGLVYPTQLTVADYIAMINNINNDKKNKMERV